MPSVHPRRQSISNSGPGHHDRRSIDRKTSVSFEAIILAVAPATGQIIVRAKRARHQHSRRWLDLEILLCLTSATLSLPDWDGDGASSIADLYPGDVVIVGARLPRGAKSIDGPLSVGRIEELEPSPAKLAMSPFFNRAQIGPWRAVNLA